MFLKDDYIYKYFCIKIRQQNYFSHISEYIFNKKAGCTTASCFNTYNLHHQKAQLMNLLFSAVSEYPEQIKEEVDKVEIERKRA